MGDHTLFFYGTLMAPPVLYRVIYGTSTPTSEDFPAKDFLTVRPALLHGYRRHQVKGTDYPAIIPVSSEQDKQDDDDDTTTTTTKTTTTGEAVVRGNIVSGLTDGDVYRLDIFEGSDYVRGPVTCEILQGVGLKDAAPPPPPAPPLEAKSDAKAQKNNNNNNKYATAHDEPEKVRAQTYIWNESHTELDPHEWDFEDFKKRKMSRWAGIPDAHQDYDAAAVATAATAEEEQDENVQVDAGFADVDRAVAELEGNSSAAATTTTAAATAAAAAAPDGGVSEATKDPTGGRGFDGEIGRQLAQVQQNGGR